MSRHAAIVATGRHVPEREVTNDDLRELFDEAIPEFVDKMEASSGILTRWWAPDDWTTSDSPFQPSSRPWSARAAGLRTWT